MSWFKKILPTISTYPKKGVPEGVWSKCPACQAVQYRVELEKNWSVCAKCDHHLRMTARDRLNKFLDDAQPTELAAHIGPVDLLKFRDSKKYKDRYTQAQKKSGEKEALVVMRGTVNQIPLVAMCFEFSFVGGSMGTAVGARFVAGVEAAIEQNIPVICFCTSGGARMQEGLFSLFQMGATSTVLGRLAAKRLPFISVLLDPTMGGVSASLAMLGDIIIAEPKALIGFSGPRVIEQTIRETLPEGFQKSEFLLSHGAIDMIVDRRNMRDVVTRLLSKLLHVPCPQTDVADG